MDKKYNKRSLNSQNVRETLDIFTITKIMVPLHPGKHNVIPDYCTGSNMDDVYNKRC
jgi:hypothetical protein